MSLTHKLASLALVGTLAGGAAACGGSDSDSGSSSAASTTSSSTQSTTSTPAPAAQVDDVTGYSTKVTLDSGFVDALTSLKVTPGPVGDATISKAGVATFPITGGNVTYYKPGTVTPYVQGVLDHDGSGLSLTAGGKKVELKDFTIDPGTSVLTGQVSVDGKVAAPTAPLFFLDGTTLKPLRTNADGSKAVLEGTTVELKQEAADLLNQTFGITALKGGLKVGVAKITINTK